MHLQKKGDTGKDIKYEISSDSYAKDDTSNDDYKYTAPSIAGFKSEKVDTERLSIGNFYGKVHDIYKELTGEKAPDDAPEEAGDVGELPDYTCDVDDEDCGGVALKNLNDEIAERLETDSAYKKYYEFKKKYLINYHTYPVGIEGKLEFGDDNAGDKLGENGIITIDYSRKSYDVQFYNADGNAISNAKDGAATEKLPYEYSLTKRGKKDLKGEDADLYYDGGKVKSYDDSVTKDGGDNIATQFDGKYTFTLNNKTYSIERPKNLPKDYVFKGWALDQAGTQLINGKINDNSEGTEGEGKGKDKDKGEVKDITMPFNDIKLYAAWGEPTDIQHTVTLDYDMSETDSTGNDADKKPGTVKVYHGKPLTLEGTPTRKGYYFYGWELAKKGDKKLETHTPYAFENKVVEDITLKAVWVKDARHSGTFNNIFLKPGVTIEQYNSAADSDKAAMVDHIYTQTVSGLRAYLRYNAEALKGDETYFPDKHFVGFEVSEDNNKNTATFVYQAYDTRKYRVKYVDQNGKDILPEREVSSANQKYDVVFYKPIAGFKPRTLQKSITYSIDANGKQTNEEITFVYDDVRMLKRKDDKQFTPTNYTCYVFKVADNQSSMGSIVDWKGVTLDDGSVLVYDVVKGAKASQIQFPTVQAKPGYEFVGWTSQIASLKEGSTDFTYVPGDSRLPSGVELQKNPKVIYIANFRLKPPTPPAPPTQPAPQPPVVIPSAPSAPVLPFDVCECNDSEPCATQKPETKEPSEPAPAKPALAKTGSNVAQSAIIASLLASVGLVGFVGKHHRKREDKE